MHNNNTKNIHLNKMLHLVSQNIYHDKIWILLTNDTYISKVHQLNQICDFNICLANWVSNLFLNL